MNTEAELIAKLLKVEALFARPGSEGERVAAGNALDRIRERLMQLERVEPVVEFQFSLQDRWSRALFTALARRYGLAPFRYRRQRRTTVMLKVTQTFLDETLWPEFCQADEALGKYLDEVTDRVIAQAVSGDLTDLEERSGAGGAARGSGVIGAGGSRDSEQAAGG